MEKLLILVADYPNNEGGVSLMYVHTRNKYYTLHDIDVTVLNFSAKIGYVFDGIRVISLEEYTKEREEYDALVLHAANIRNHYCFLKKYEKNFKKMFFFYHGHEVLRITKVYSKPYEFIHRNYIKELFQDCYDCLKLKIWNNYLPKIKYKSEFIFVSKWMYEQFLINTKIKENEIKDKVHITYNSIGKTFEVMQYDEKKKKEYDFVTVRSNLDNSKYAIDIVNRLAKNTPEARFLLIGKGEFFNHNEKADNLTWINGTMLHKEIVEQIQNARYALMPTRTDAQGLMMCEMAALGIPLITSDIPVCHEIFGDFENVYYINNDDYNLDLYKYYYGISKAIKHSRYFQENTVQHEVELMKVVLNRG